MTRNVTKRAALDGKRHVIDISASAHYVGDCRELLKRLPDRSVQTIVTSPPYFGLRDYGLQGQIGLEETLVEFIETLVVDVFREARRVLADDGTRTAQRSLVLP